MNITVMLILVSPIFFALGWIAGRVDMKTVVKQARQLPQKLYDGIDALIENKTGVASDYLDDITNHEPHLIDLKLSLGKLYRMRGENDIAIKTHTKLLNSQFLLNKDDKNKIRLELAKDFTQAGLVDRAEILLVKLLDSDLYANKAQQFLLNIYQQDKNWLEAINSAKKLSHSEYGYHIEIAQFYCELAKECLIKSDTIKAEEYLNNALDTNRKCVRANILLGELYYNQEQYYEAINKWQLIEKQNYLYLTMVAEQVFDSYIQLNLIKEALTLMRGYFILYPELNLSDFIYHKLIIYDHYTNVLKYLRHTMKNSNNAKAAARMIELYIKYNINKENIKNAITNNDNNIKINSHTSNEIIQNYLADAKIIEQSLLNYHDKLSRFKCGRCNFKAKTFFWQCPACYEWESINPMSIE